MKGIRLGYGCFLTIPIPPKGDLPPSLQWQWQWQPYADFQTWWNEQPVAHETFPLLMGAIDTPMYLALILAVGETDNYDRQSYPLVQTLGNTVLPLEHLSARLCERFSPDLLALADQAWTQVVEDAVAQGLVLERQAMLLFIYEQELCEEP
jgi:hypothetical protein